VVTSSFPERRTGNQKRSTAQVILAASYAQLERAKEGRSHVEAVLASRPDFSCAQHRSRLLFQSNEDRDRIVAGLLKAGLPD
jgi:Tfp pilus assembly protein PilF